MMNALPEPPLSTTPQFIAKERVIELMALNAGQPLEEAKVFFANAYNIEPLLSFVALVEAEVIKAYKKRKPGHGQRRIHQ